MSRIRTTVTVPAGDGYFVADRVIVVGKRHHPGNEFVPAEVPADVAEAWLADGHASAVAERVAKPKVKAKPKAKKR